MNCQACGSTTNVVKSDGGFVFCERCKRPNGYSSQLKSSIPTHPTHPTHPTYPTGSNTLAFSLSKQRSLAYRLMIFVAWSVVAMFVIRFIVTEWTISQGATRYGSLANTFASFLLSMLVFPLIAYFAGMLFSAATRKAEIATSKTNKIFEPSKPSETSKARSVEERLNELKLLHDSGLIDASDYSLKKQNILSDL